MTKNAKTDLLLTTVLFISWLCVSIYTFNKKPDMNGDNFGYYNLSTALVTGHGYSDVTKADCPPTSVSPPVYPMLMTPLRLVTDSIIAQKWMNEIFVLLSLIIIYFTLLHLKFSKAVAFTVSVCGAFIPRLLHFSTMMMTESSSLLTSVLALYCLVRLGEQKEDRFSEVKSGWLYLTLLFVLLNYHTRTQGLALAAGILLYFLVRGRWSALVATAAGFVAGCLPWIIRNRIKGVGGSRYLDMIMFSNPWRPEDGTLDFSGFVERFFKTLKMLIFNALPNTVLPFINVNPNKPTYNFYIYLTGVIVLFLIVIGCIRLGKSGWAAGGYMAATLGLISCFSAPSGSRYITSLLPLFLGVELIGLWSCINYLVNLKRKRAKVTSVPIWLLIPLMLLSRPGIELEHKIAENFFTQEIADYIYACEVLKKAPKGSVICARKEPMTYFYSGHPVYRYNFTSDKSALIKAMIQNNVDYVIVDALGYASTGKYLIPAMNEYNMYFNILQKSTKTNTFIVRFNRAAAAVAIDSSI